MFWRLWVCSDKRKYPVCMVRPAGPNLLSVNDKVITFVNAFCLQTGEVGTSARFAISLTPADLTADDFW